MEHAPQVEQIHSMFHLLEDKTTTMAEDIYQNPVKGYTCEKRLAAEKEKLFCQYPLLMGLSCDLPNPGDYLTDDYCGVPVVIIRTKTGKLNAFLNVCRHRGAKVAEGCGSGKRAFHCPYHGWSYDQEGQLIAIPHEDGFTAVDRKNQGLRRLPVVEKDGMIWLKTVPGEDFDIGEMLGDLVPEMQSYGIENYHHYETRTIQVDMNWKLIVDTFLETYHLKFLHPTTAAVYLHTNVGAFDPFGQHLRLIYSRHIFDELRDIPENDWDLYYYSTIVYVLFPNTVFIMQKDHFEIFRIFPWGDNPNHGQMYVSLYTPEKAISEEAKAHWDANMNLLTDTVQTEDFPLGENMQKGFHSLAQQHITYGQNEPALAHFHTSIKQALEND